MRIYRGVVKGNAIVLPKDVHLADGLPVEVRVVARQSPMTNEIEPEESAERRMIEAGVISATRAYSPRPHAQRTPLKVKGKPLSQVIINERR